MKTKKKVRKLFFILTVKTPITVLIIITFTIGGLLYLAYNNYISEYVKAQGDLKDHNQNIEIEIDKKYSKYIDISNDVLWYVDINGKRYKGKIAEISNEKNMDKQRITINLDENDIKQVSYNTVTVEVLVKKVRIRDNLLSKKGVD